MISSTSPHNTTPSADHLRALADELNQSRHDIHRGVQAPSLELLALAEEAVEAARRVRLALERDSSLADAVALLAAAHAFGMTFPAPAGSEYWFAEVEEDYDERALLLGVFASEDAAWTAARNYAVRQWKSNGCAPREGGDPDAWLARLSDREIVAAWRRQYSRANIYVRRGVIESAPTPKTLAGS